MNTVYLSPEEQKKALHWLSQSSKGGGWFLIGMGLFTFGLLLLGGLRLISIQAEDSMAFIVPFSLLGMAFLGLGIWLVGYKRRLQQVLAMPMTPTTAVITHIHTLPYLGWQMRLQLNTAVGEQEGTIRVVVKPTWLVGERLEVLLLNNGRFFPRELSQAVDLGQVITPQYRQRRWRWIGCGVVAFLGLAALAFLLGLYGQGRWG